MTFSINASLPMRVIFSSLELRRGWAKSRLLMRIAKADLEHANPTGTGAQIFARTKTRYDGQLGSFIAFLSVSATNLRLVRMHINTSYRFLQSRRCFGVAFICHGSTSSWKWPWSCTRSHLHSGWATRCCRSTGGSGPGTGAEEVIFQALMISIFARLGTVFSL